MPRQERIATVKNGSLQDTVFRCLEGKEPYLVHLQDTVFRFLEGRDHTDTPKGAWFIKTFVKVPFTPVPDTGKI